MSFNPTSDKKSLIAKFLTNDLTPQEEHQLRHWVDESPEHASYFENLFETWEHLQNLPESRLLDEDKAWKKLEARISEGVPEKSQNRRVSFFSLRMAVGLFLISIVLSTMGWFIFFSENEVARSMPFQLEEEVEGLIILDGDNMYWYQEDEDVQVLPLSASPPQLIKDMLPKIAVKPTNTGSFSFSLIAGEVFLQSRDERIRLSEGRIIEYSPSTGKFLVRPSR